MIRNILAVILFSLIITLGILDQVNIQTSFDQLTARTEQIEEYLNNDDSERAKDLANDTLTWWEKKQDILELTCPHNEVKDFATVLSQLVGYINVEDKDNALASCIVVKTDATTRKQILSYKLKNVF